MLPINVLSLFDGISCGQAALERAGIFIEKYYASEIDKYAIQITQKNYPNTIQLGDVTKVKGNKLPKIDLLIAGSPCQGFSRAGKGLNFDDPRSKLFFDFVRIKKECNPKYFLLENVRMKKEHQDVISKYLGVEPILIDSNLVSAQNRKRLYWTNIQEITQPKDKNIYLKDILEKNVDIKYNLKDGWLQWYLKNREFQLKKKYCSENGNKAICMTARQYSSYNGNFITPLIFQLPHGVNNGGFKSQNGKTPSLTTAQWSYNNLLNGIRRLTPIECERLQTLTDNYTEGISDTQRYKCLGNGWTVDVIAHILSFAKWE